MKSLSGRAFVSFTSLCIACITQGITFVSAQEFGWDRFPALGIPHLPEAPAIDGNLDTREWIGAAKLPPIINTETELPYPNQTEIFAGYTNEALYLGWRIHREPGPMRINHKEAGHINRGGPWSDDSIELLIDIEGLGKEAIQFGANAAGAYGDLLLTRDPTSGQTRRDASKSWNWEYAARETPDAWEGELRIPFENLGLSSAPEPNTEWGFDFARADKLPIDRYGFLSWRDRLEQSDLSRISRLVFTGKAPAFRLQELGEIGETSAGVMAELINLTDQEQKVLVEYGIYLFPEGRDVPKIYSTIDSGLNEEGIGGVMAFTTLENQINQVVNLYEPLVVDIKEEVVQANSRKGLTLLANDVPAGSMLIAWNVYTAEGVTLASGLIPMEKNPPVQIAVTPYFLSSDVLDVRIQLHSEPLDQAANRFLVRLKQHGEILEEMTVDSSIQGERIVVPSNQVEEGLYELLVSVLDIQGESVADVALELNRPIPWWVKDPQGVSSFVPPPFEPVEVEGDTVKIIGREYIFPPDHFLPAQMIAEGEGLFAEAPHLVALIDGLRAELKGSLTLGDSNPEYARYHFTGNLGPVSVEATTQIEFDGFIIIELKLKTEGHTLDQLWIEFPVKTEHAELYTLNAFYNERNHRPDMDEMLALSGGISKAGRINDGFSIGFNHAVWIGTPNRGFQWVADTAEHWSFGDRSTSIEITPEQGSDTTVFRLRVVDQPVTSDQLHYKWGLMAGPVKPLGSRGQEMYYGQTGGNYRHLDHDSTKERIKAEKRFAEAYKEVGGEWYNVFSNWNWDIFGQPFMEDSRIKERREFNEWLQSQGFKTTWYTGWNAMHPSMALYPYYGEAMRRIPTRFSWGGYKECTNAGYVPYLAGGAVWMIENIGMDGIYLDSTHGPEFCEEELHGCGFVDPDTGERIVTRDIFGRRELFKRLYKIFHGEVLENGIVYSHDGWAPILGIVSFIDVNHTAEDAQLENYHDLDFYLAQYNPTQYGVPVEKAWRADHVVDRNHAWGVSLVHGNRVKMYPHRVLPTSSQRHTDYESDFGIDWRMWAPSQWFDWERDWTWYPYYNNDSALRVAAEGEVVASFHINDGGQVLFTAFNNEETERTGEFTLNIQQLGLPATLHAVDVITEETFEINNGRIQLDIHGKRPRVLLIAPDPVDLTTPPFHTTPTGIR